MTSQFHDDPSNKNGKDELARRQRVLREGTDPTSGPVRAYRFEEWRDAQLSNPGARYDDARSKGILEEIYTRFEAVFFERGISPDQLSAMAGVARNTIRTLLTRQGRPTKEALQRIARAYGLEPNYFIHREN